MGSGQIDRRTFMKVSSGVLAAGLAPAVAAEAKAAEAKVVVALDKWCAQFVDCLQVNARLSKPLEAFWKDVCDDFV